jgi:hypothetical protein
MSAFSHIRFQSYVLSIDTSWSTFNGISHEYHAQIIVNYLLYIMRHIYIHIKILSMLAE